MTSLHTIYRPKTFDEVLGQEAVVRSLRRVVKDGRAKAFLFTGPPGTGKTTLARILANSFCGDTATAINIDEVDGASESGAEDCRKLVARIQYRAVGASPNRFIIVDEAHRLSAAAWTILLKPVEEPPAHVYWAFCTTEVAKVNKAIVTRCLRYDLKPVKEELILDLLCKVADAEKLEISDEIIEAIAENCGGSPRQALVYLEECLSCKSATEARAIMRDAGQSKELVDLARWLLSGKAHNWAEAVKYLKALEGQEAESCRIMLCNYFAKVLLNTKSEKQAKPLLAILECFNKPYYTPDKMAPLIHSVAMAIGMDQA